VLTRFVTDGQTYRRTDGDYSYGPPPGTTGEKYKINWADNFEEHSVSVSSINSETAV